MFTRESIDMKPTKQKQGNIQYVGVFRFIFHNHLIHNESLSIFS